MKKSTRKQRSKCIALALPSCILPNYIHQNCVSCPVKRIVLQCVTCVCVFHIYHYHCYSFSFPYYWDTDETNSSSLSVLFLFPSLSTHWAASEPRAEEIRRGRSRGSWTSWADELLSGDVIKEGNKKEDKKRWRLCALTELPSRHSMMQHMLYNSTAYRDGRTDGAGPCNKTHRPELRTTTYWRKPTAQYWGLRCTQTGGRTEMKLWKWSAVTRELCSG